MLDLNFIRQNQEIIQDTINRRKMKMNVSLFLDLDKKRRELIAQTDELRAERNALSAQIPDMDQAKKKQAIERVKALKQDLSRLQSALDETQLEFEEMWSNIPNLLSDNVPSGESDEDNLEIKRNGEPSQFDFTPKDHLEIATNLDLLDFDRVTKVSGSKFYFLKNDGVLLDLALMQYALSIIGSAGFAPIKTPVLARQEILSGTGYNPKGEETQIYSIQGTDLGMIATSEITIAGYMKDEIIDQSDLPILYAGLSECYRTEAGNYGRFSKGLYRVHHFDKVEMFAFTHPQQSEQIHAQILALEEKIFSGLEIPYRVVDICDADMGAVAYRKYDLEAWMPGRGEQGAWGEVTSCSNCTDYQARRLNIRYKTDEGELDYVHTLNGTALAISRALIAIIENYQQRDGTVLIPKVLQPYLGKDKIMLKPN